MWFVRYPKLDHGQETNDISLRKPRYDVMRSRARETVLWKQGPTQSFDSEAPRRKPYVP